MHAVVSNLFEGFQLSDSKGLLRFRWFRWTRGTERGVRVRQRAEAREDTEKGGRGRFLCRVHILVFAHGDSNEYTVVSFSLLSLSLPKLYCKGAVWIWFSFWSFLTPIKNADQVYEGFWFVSVLGYPLDGQFLSYQKFFKVATANPYYPGGIMK